MGAMMGFSSYKTGLGLSIEITAQCDYDFVRYRSTLTYLLTYLLILRWKKTAAAWSSCICVAHLRKTLQVRSNELMTTFHHLPSELCSSRC